MATFAEINSFLAQAKAALASNNYKILDKRWKYTSTLAQLSLIEQDVLDDLLNLSVMKTGLKNQITILFIQAMSGSAKKCYTINVSI